MNITRLEVAGLRAFKHDEFEFVRGMNLLVGVNGVGKTTVLDTLRVCLSKFLPDLNSAFTPWLSFAPDDIRVGSPSLRAQVFFEANGCTFKCEVHKTRQPKERLGRSSVQRRSPQTPDVSQLTLLKGERRRNEEPHLAMFFSTRRAFLSDWKPKVAKAAKGLAGAVAYALHGRELELAETAFWMHAQERLAPERPLARRHLAALGKAVSRFLPELGKLQARTSPKPTLVLEKEGVPLDIRQLSDGERGLLAIVLEIARRLSQANPTLADPIGTGRAVVLIDELDLHLHPKWQRTVVERLTRTFPRCQFIATTHSPQVVASVRPEQVLLLTTAGVIRPDRSLGMDSNWILRHLMEADDRPAGAADVVTSVESSIRRRAFKLARRAISTAKKNGLDLPEWSILEARMARMEMLAK